MRQFLPAFLKYSAIVTLLMASAAIESSEISSASPLRITTSIEYQVISQEYYDAIWQAQIDTASIDPLEETWKFSRDKIDDFIFRTNLTYRRGEMNRRLNIIGNMEYSSDRFLGRAEGYWKFGNSDNQLKLFGKIESKLSLNNEEEAGEGYNYFQTYIKSNHRLSQAISLIFNSGIETIFFDDEATADQFDGDDSLDSNSGFNSFFSNYNYSIYFGRVEGIIRLNDFSHRFYWRMEYNHRLVPDSGESEYDDYRFDIEYEFFGTGSSLDLAANLEFKDYTRAGGKDDYFNLNLRGRWNRKLGRNFESNLSASLSDYRYSVVDLISRNYRVYRVELKPLKQTDDWGAGPLIRLEYRDEEPNGDYAEKYSQSEIGLTVSYFSLRSLFFDTEISYGYRDYNQGSTILSSYHFIGISAIINCKLWKMVSANLIFDGSFETHAIKEDNSNLYLLSSSISASF